MTNEEAIVELRALAITFNLGTATREALGQAITALEDIVRVTEDRNRVDLEKCAWVTEARKAQRQRDILIRALELVLDGGELS